jgi:amidase
MGAEAGFTRRQILRYGAGGALIAAGVTPQARALAALSPSGPTDFEEATIADLRAALRRRDISARELTQWYLDRIDQLNPLLRAVIETNPDALSIAQHCDRDKRHGSHGPVLQGIPVLLKDNIATRDRMQTGAGSLALVGSRVRQDAPIVRNLRDAGAIVLGKANLSEWANFRGFAPFNGWSARAADNPADCFTRNPYQLDFEPCGSSTGSAAAVAANLAAVAVGTETDGSIVCPAGEQNLVGIKPTIGLVSQRGIIPIAASQDTAGPMTRTVHDAATLLNVLRSPFGRVARHSLPRDYTRFVGTKPVDQLRLLIDTNYVGGDLGTSDDRQAVFDSAVEALRQTGATIDAVRLADPFEPVDGLAPWDAEFTVLLFEFKVQIAEYLATVRDTELRTLADLIQFNLDHCPEEMKYYGQEIFELAEATSGDLNDPEYTVARDLNRGFSRDVIDGVRAQGYDAIITPTFSFGTTTAATAGYPSMAVPVGFTDAGRPAGFWLAAGFLEEPRLIAVGSAIEAFFGARRAPQLLGAAPPEPPDAGLCVAPLETTRAAAAAPTDRLDALRQWRMGCCSI